MGRLAIDALLERLYAADLSEACFEPFLQELGVRLDSHVLALHTHHVAAGYTTLVNGVGVDSFLQARWDEVANDNVWFQRGADDLLRNGISGTGHLATRDELHRTRFHADFLRMVDLEHGMGMFLGNDGDQALVVLSINRSERYGDYTADEQALAKSLLPHLRNAFALHRRLRGLRDMEHACHSVFDRIDQPLFLLARDGTVLLGNERAQELEAGGTCLRRRLGRPAAVNPVDDAHLQLALDRVAAGATGGDPVSLALHDRSGRLAALASIFPTPPPVFSNWSHANVAFALFVRPLQSRKISDDVRLAFGFTAAEFRLAALLVDGLPLGIASERLGISKNTARTQLRALFDKAGVHRQPELVALLQRSS